MKDSEKIIVMKEKRQHMFVSCFASIYFIYPEQGE